MSDHFTGYPPETVIFLKDLKANNNREWFTAHKKPYEATIKEPSKAFCVSMGSALEAMAGVAHRAKIFRIYRDVRFSKDKTPYNAHVRISFTPEQGGENRPAWFFGIETDHIVLGMGLFGFDKTGLERFRGLIVEKPGAELETYLERLTTAGYRIGEPELKRIPSGYDKEHARAERLRHKSLTVWKDYPDATAAHDAGLIEACLSTFQEMKPLYDWLRKV